MFFSVLKASKTIRQNNQIVTACDIKVYQYEMTMNKKSTMIGLIIDPGHILERIFDSSVELLFKTLRNTSEAIFPL